MVQYFTDENDLNVFQILLKIIFTIIQYYLSVSDLDLIINELPMSFISLSLRQSCMVRCTWYIHTYKIPMFFLLQTMFYLMFMSPSLPSSLVIFHKLTSSMVIFFTKFNGHLLYLVQWSLSLPISVVTIFTYFNGYL